MLPPRASAGRPRSLSLSALTTVRLTNHTSASLASSHPAFSHARYSNVAEIGRSSSIRRSSQCPNTSQYPSRHLRPASYWHGDREALSKRRQSVQNPSHAKHSEGISQSTSDREWKASMAKLRRLVDRDPYEAVFGKRIEPFWEALMPKWIREELGMGTTATAETKGSGESVNTERRARSTESDQSVSATAYASSKFSSPSSASATPASRAYSSSASAATSNGSDMDAAPNGQLTNYSYTSATSWDSWTNKTRREEWDSVSGETRHFEYDPISNRMVKVARGSTVGDMDAANAASHSSGRAIPVPTADSAGKSSTYFPSLLKTPPPTYTEDVAAADAQPISSEFEQDLGTPTTAETGPAHAFKSRKSTDQEAEDLSSLTAAQLRASMGARSVQSSSASSATIPISREFEGDIASFTSEDIRAAFTDNSKTSPTSPKKPRASGLDTLLDTYRSDSHPQPSKSTWEQAEDDVALERELEKHKRPPTPKRSLSPTPRDKVLQQTKANPDRVSYLQEQARLAARRVEREAEAAALEQAKRDARDARLLDDQAACSAAVHSRSAVMALPPAAPSSSESDSPAAAAAAAPNLQATAVATAKIIDLRAEAKKQTVATASSSASASGSAAANADVDVDHDARAFIATLAVKVRKLEADCVKSTSRLAALRRELDSSSSSFSSSSSSSSAFPAAFAVPAAAAAAAGPVSHNHAVHIERICALERDARNYQDQICKLKTDLENADTERDSRMAEAHVDRIRNLEREVRGIRRMVERAEEAVRKANAAAKADDEGKLVGDVAVWSYGGARSAAGVRPSASGSGGVAEQARWYNTRPAATREKKAGQREQRDAGGALVDEVRGIYERAYGVIDGKHRQGGGSTTAADDAGAAAVDGDAQVPASSSVTEGAGDQEPGESQRPDLNHVLSEYERHERLPGYTFSQKTAPQFVDDVARALAAAKPQPLSQERQAEEAKLAKLVGRLDDPVPVVQPERIAAEDQSVRNTPEDEARLAEELRRVREGNLEGAIVPTRPVKREGVVGEPMTSVEEERRLKGFLGKLDDFDDGEVGQQGKDANAGVVGTSAEEEARLARFVRGADGLDGGVERPQQEEEVLHLDPQEEQRLRNLTGKIDGFVHNASPVEEGRSQEDLRLSKLTGQLDDYRPLARESVEAERHSSPAEEARFSKLLGKVDGFAAHREASHEQQTNAAEDARLSKLVGKVDRLDIAQDTSLQPLQEETSAEEARLSKLVGKIDDGPFETTTGNGDGDAASHAQVHSALRTYDSSPAARRAHLHRRTQPPIYKVLAWDAVTGQVSTVETRSALFPIEEFVTGAPEEHSLTLAQAMERLDAPGKFARELAAAQGEGFRVVGAGAEWVVCRKDVAEGMPDFDDSVLEEGEDGASGRSQPQQQRRQQQSSVRSINPLDGSHSPPAYVLPPGARSSRVSSGHSELESGKSSFVDDSSSSTGASGRGGVDPSAGKSTGRHPHRRVRREESVFSGARLPQSATARSSTSAAATSNNSPSPTETGRSRWQHFRERQQMRSAQAQDDLRRFRGDDNGPPRRGGGRGGDRRRRRRWRWAGLLLKGSAGAAFFYAIWLHGVSQGRQIAKVKVEGCSGG